MAQKVVVEEMKIIYIESMNLKKCLMLCFLLAMRSSNGVPPHEGPSKDVGKDGTTGIWLSRNCQGNSGVHAHPSTEYRLSLSEIANSKSGRQFVTKMEEFGGPKAEIRKTYWSALPFKGVGEGSKLSPPGLNTAQWINTASSNHPIEGVPTKQLYFEQYDVQLDRKRSLLAQISGPTEGTAQPSLWGSSATAYDEYTVSMFDSLGNFVELLAQSKKGTQPPQTRYKVHKLCKAYPFSDGLGFRLDSLTHPGDERPIVSVENVFPSEPAGGGQYISKLSDPKELEKYLSAQDDLMAVARREAAAAREGNASPLSEIRRIVFGSFK